MVSELTNSKHLSRQTFNITQHWFVRQDVVEILGTKTLEGVLIEVSGQTDPMTKAAKIKEEFTDPA
jgi:prophage antirepressor-like protein